MMGNYVFNLKGFIMRKRLPKLANSFKEKFNFLKTLLSISFIVFSTVVLAVPKTWIGAGVGVGGGTGTDFNTGANWNPAGVPTSADDVTIAFDGFGTINLSANASIGNLIITIIRNTNNPTVNLIVGLDPFNDDFLGNLSINGSAILNVALS
jgi:hypothetical protein